MKLIFVMSLEQFTFELEGSTISKLKYFLTLAIMVSVVVSENLQKIKKIRRFRSPGEKIEDKIDDLPCKQLLLVRLYLCSIQ